MLQICTQLYPGMEIHFHWSALGKCTTSFSTPKITSRGVASTKVSFAARSWYEKEHTLIAKVVSKNYQTSANYPE